SVNFCLENKEDWIFHQDNATYHKSEKIMKLLKQKKKKIMNFPTNSPDLNPIEYLVDKYEKIKNLIKSIPKRIQAVKKGDLTIGKFELNFKKQILSYSGNYKKFF
ncbi:hypothetical protein RFI_21483, partial [Reticulomyxa filosa]